MRRVLAIAISCLASLAAQDRPDAVAVRASGLAAASQALAAGRLDEAERHLTQVAALGRDIRVEILRGELLVARKDPAGAAKLLEEAIRTLQPAGDLARAAHRTHARALVELGRYGDAAPAILRSFGLDAAAASSLALSARGLAEIGDRALARGVLGLAFHLDPKRTDLLATRAELALEDGDSTAALRDAEALVARLPADRAARLLRARALHAAGRPGEARDALRVLDRAGALDPPLLRVLADLDLEGGSIDEAEAVLRRLGPLTQSDAATLARAWLDRGEPRKALGLLDGVDSGTTALLRLRVHAHLEMLDGARALLMLAQIPEPATEDRIAEARAHRLSGDLAAAARILEPLLETEPALHAARVDLIGIRVLEGGLAAARRLLADGLVLAPHHPPFARALEDLVSELAPPDGATTTAVLGARSFAFDGEPIADDAAEALPRLRTMRLAFGQTAPTVRLVLQGRLDAPAIQRAFDLLTAAGFSRIAVEGR